MNKLLSITETAHILNVSLNTLRNWDTAGYLPSIKTKGGHRKYDESLIQKHITGEIWKRSEMYDMLTSYRKTITDEAVAEFKNTPNFDKLSQIKNFSIEDLAILYRNHKLCNIPVNCELWVKCLPKMLTPSLCKTRSMIGVCDISFYKRPRNDVFVIESEDVLFTIKKQDFYVWNDLEKQKHILEASETLVNEIDSENISNMANNAHKIITVNDPQKIHESIKCSLELLSNHLAEERWVVVPPELSLYVKESKDYKLYVSRHIHERKILVGTKSDSEFDSYAFSPFIVFNQIEDKMNMYFGRKLFREGSKGYVTIQLEN